VFNPGHLEQSQKAASHLVMIVSSHLKITSCSRCPGVIHKRTGDVSEWLASCKACEKARWQPNEHLGLNKAITQAIHFEDVMTHEKKIDSTLKYWGEMLWDHFCISVN